MSEKIELLKSANVVAEFWGVSVKDLLAFNAMINKGKMEEWNKLAEEVIKFYDLPIKERAKELFSEGGNK